MRFGPIIHEVSSAAIISCIGAICNILCMQTIATIVVNSCYYVLIEKTKLWLVLVQLEFKPILY